MSLKFNITLNEEQKNAKTQILNNTLSVISGKPGSGKTLLACQIALEALLNKKECEKIVISRPQVSKESIGYLPGDMYEKMDPFMQPIYQNFYMLYKKELIDKLIEEGKIELVPVAFMRGRTFMDSYIIIDESQNLTFEQLKMITERIGKRSKMMICGDADQIDLNKIDESGFSFLCEMADNYHAVYDIDGVDRKGGMCHVELQTNNRSEIVDYIIDYFTEHGVSTKKALAKTKNKKTNQ